MVMRHTAVGLMQKAEGLHTGCRFYFSAMHVGKVSGAAGPGRTYVPPVYLQGQRAEPSYCRGYGLPWGPSCLHTVHWLR